MDNTSKSTQVLPTSQSSQQRRFNLSAQEGDFGYDTGEVLFDNISWEAPTTTGAGFGPWECGGTGGIEMQTEPSTVWI